MILTGGAVSILRGVRPAESEDIDFYCVREDIMNSIEEAAEAIADEMELPELHEQQHSIVHQPQQLRKGCWEVLQPNDIIFQNEVTSLGRRLRISVIFKATDRMSNDVERGAGMQKKDRIGSIYYLQELIRSMQRSSSKGDRFLPK